MPFSLGSKVSLKSTAARPASEATLYGFTNIEDHEDLSNSDVPLTYVEPVDSGGIFTNRLVAISKTDIVDLYFIGQGDTGACFSEAVSDCTETCLQRRDGCECSQCSGGGQGIPVCESCGCDRTCVCTGYGTYATGGTGVPYYVRLDFSSVSENVWSSKQPGYISIEQFTQSANGSLREMEVEVGIVGGSSTNILYTESNTIQGGDVGTVFACLSSQCNACNNCDYPVPGFGSPVDSGILVSNGLNATITVEAYGDPISDGTLESILYSDFGWSGMTGVTWDYYGTGGTGCYVSRSPCSGPGLAGGFVCGGANDPGNFRKGRFLGVAINPTFEP